MDAPCPTAYNPATTEARSRSDGAVTFAIVPTNLLRDIPAIIGQRRLTSCDSPRSKTTLWSESFRKAEARVDRDPIAIDAGFDRAFDQQRSSSAVTSAIDVIINSQSVHDLGCATHVHQDHGALEQRDDPGRKRWIKAQSRNIVDDRWHRLASARSIVDCMARVDRHAGALPSDGFDNREDAALFFGRV